MLAAVGAPQSKLIPRLVEHIAALLLRKVVNWRRTWKDRLLFVLFDYNLYRISAGAHHPALALEVLPDRSKLPWEWKFMLGGLWQVLGTKQSYSTDFSRSLCWT